MVPEVACLGGKVASHSTFLRIGEGLRVDLSTNALVGTKPFCRRPTFLHMDLFGLRLWVIFWGRMDIGRSIGFGTFLVRSSTEKFGSTPGGLLYPGFVYKIMAS